MSVAPNKYGAAFKRTLGDATGAQSALLVPTAYRVLHFAEASDYNTDWNVSNPTHPTFYVHSATTPATDYMSLSHDGTTGLLTVAGGTLSLNGVTSLGLQVGGTEEVTLTATDLSPTTNAGSALGTTALGWNGLHLATGTAINWVNGDVTLTHSAGALTIAGGNLIFTATAATEADNIDANLTVTAATSGTRRLIHGNVTLTPSTTFSVSGSGSIAATRGLITVSSGKTFVDGFLYGAEGRIVLDGTMAESSAGRLVGVLGKMALGSGTITAGQASAVWGDVTGNPTLTQNDGLVVGRWTNSMTGGKLVQAFGYYYGLADFLWEFGADGGVGGAQTWIVAAGVGGSQSHKIKVNAFGTTYYIPLNTA